MSTDPTQYTFHTSASLLINLRKWDDKKSWEEFYGLYRELVYGFARRSGLSHEEAREATDKVFIRVGMTIQEFDKNPGKVSFRAWLMKHTLTQVSDKLRNRGQAPRILHIPESEQASSKDHRGAGRRPVRIFSRMARWTRGKFS